MDSDDQNIDVVRLGGFRRSTPANALLQLGFNFLDAVYFPTPLPSFFVFLPPFLDGFLTYSISILHMQGALHHHRMHDIPFPQPEFMYLHR
jgi:hypothetical protein